MPDPLWNPVLEVNDATARYFRDLGYVVTWDYRGRERWYEILKGSTMVCQFDFGVPLRDLFMDLPHLLAGRSGPSTSDYKLNCVQLPLLRELYEKMRAQPPLAGG